MTLPEVDVLDLDANASVPCLPEALEALAACARTRGNPSSPHALGRAARAVLDGARAHVARALGGQAKEVVFTSGASEANRWIVDAVALHGAQRGQPLQVWASPLEHPSLHKPLLAAGPRVALTVGRVSRAGALDLDDPALALADVVVVTAAHNETGVLPPLDDVVARLRADAILCVDAAQAVGRLPPVPARVDVVVASAHKMGGVAGAGALLVRGRARALPPPWSGGGQEGGLRPGTEALALLAAFGAAAAVVDDTRARHRALAPLCRDLEQRLLAAWPGATALGAALPRLPHTSAITLPFVDGDALRMAIDGVGVCVGFGSACSALAPEPSPALLALGLTAREARATVRFSLASSATAAQVHEAVARVGPVGAALIARGRARAPVPG